MAKVIGLGGVFFKSRDPQALGEWYQKWLGVPVESAWGGATFKPDHMPPGGYSVWSPFPADTKYFAPAEQSFMMNLVVDDLDGVLAQVSEGGAEIVGEIEESDFGRFGWFLDPEGSKVELWQPPAK